MSREKGRLHVNVPWNRGPCCRSPFPMRPPPRSANLIGFGLEPPNANSQHQLGPGSPAVLSASACSSSVPLRRWRTLCDQKHLQYELLTQPGTSSAFTKIKSHNPPSPSPPCVVSIQVTRGHDHVVHTDGRNCEAHCDKNTHDDRNSPHDA